MSQFIANIHNLWLMIPVGIRAALSFSVAVLVASAIALVQGYGWFIPTSTDALKGEAIAFITYAVPVLAVLVTQLVRSQIAPAVVQWFLSTFGFQSGVAFSKSAALPVKTGLWVKVPA
jgi:hypothetical protein